MTVGSDKIMMGKQAIMDYLQMSEHTFFKFVGMGLPVRVIDKRYCAHKDNLDRYFENLTSKETEAGK